MVKLRGRARVAATLTTMESYKIVFMKLTYQRIAFPITERINDCKRGII